MLGKSPRKRIFVCFDILNDSHLRDFVVSQSKQIDSSYIVTDYSRKWEPPEKQWKEQLRKTISLVDLVFIMVGKKTFKASNVLEELALAINVGKPVMQFCDPAYKYAECKPVRNAGKLYKWEWENLKAVLLKLQHAYKS